MEVPVESKERLCQATETGTGECRALWVGLHYKKPCQGEFCEPFSSIQYLLYSQNPANLAGKVVGNDRFLNFTSLDPIL
jgi:hypothetical protein